MCGMWTMKLLVVGLLAIGFLVGAAGCGGPSWQADTYPARGRITINGQPPAGAVITLVPAGQKVDQRGSKPWGIVDQRGEFNLSTYQSGDGAPAGEYVVTVRWPVDVTNMAAAMVDRLSGAYATPQRSTYKLTVAPGENEFPVIAITGAKVQSAKAAASRRRAPPMPGVGGQ